MKGRYHSLSNKNGHGKIKYKALMCDVDGTLIPLKRDAKPSKKVIEAIAKASGIVHVGIATSRPLYMLHNILDSLKLSGPSIINGGAQILDTVNKKIIWEKGLNLDDINKVHIILKLNKVKTIVLENDRDIIYDGTQKLKNPLQIWVNGIKERLADKILDTLSSISTISVNKVPSWQLNMVDLVINHALATKQHGIFEVSKLLKLKSHEIIGVGDGYNDFPLLMACGLKVAMGNGVSDLKQIADFIAPPVEEDGVVEIINRFILNDEKST